MVLDPDLADAGETTSIPAHRRRSRGRYVLYALLALSGFHMLGTGSPIPLWHIERLNHPVAVIAIGDDSLELQDGRNVRLPFMKKLPKGDPCFVKALARGVEVGPGGEVFGLIEPARECGNDPVIFYRKRINLSELAGMLDPDGIDDKRVHPEAIKEFKENYYSRSRDRRGMPIGFSSYVGLVRRMYESSASKANDGPVVTRMLSVD